MDKLKHTLYRSLLLLRMLSALTTTLEAWQGLRKPLFLWP